MASSEEVAAIDHRFAVYIQVSHSKQTDAVGPGSTRGIPNQRSHAG